MKNKDNINALMNSLVKSFKDLDKTMKNKIRVNSIFSSLDEYTNKNFSKLINMSDLRYKSVKSGIKLNNILSIQKPKYENLIEELKNDKLYSSNFIDTEKKKLFKNSFKYKNKEINDIRNRLKVSLRQKQQGNKNKKKENKNPKQRLSRLKSILRKVNKLAQINAVFGQKLKQKRLEEQNEKLINSLIDEDYNKFNQNIQTYQNILKNIRVITENNTNKKHLKIDKSIFRNTIENINLNRFKALTYTEASSDKNKNLPKKDFEFDVRQIKNIKISHDNNFNNKLKNKNRNSQEIKINNSNLTNISSRNKSITSNNFNSSNISNILNTQKNIESERQKKNNSVKANKFFDFKNTANVIFNETENGLFIQENFIKKINKLDNRLNLFKTFDKIEQKPIQSFNEKNINLLPNLEGNSKEKQNNKEIKEYSEKNVDAIKKKFQEIYDQKKIKWEKEDLLMDLQKERDRQNIFEIENFLFEIQDKKLLKKNRIKFNK